MNVVMHFVENVFLIPIRSIDFEGLCQKEIGTERTESSDRW